MNQDVNLEKPLAEKGLLSFKKILPLDYAIIYEKEYIKKWTIGTRLCLRRTCK